MRAPGDRLEVVGEVGGCVVLIGTVGLYTVPDEDMSVGRFHQMLNTAAPSWRIARGSGSPATVFGLIP